MFCGVSRLMRKLCGKTHHTCFEHSSLLCAQFMEEVKCELGLEGRVGSCQVDIVRKVIEGRGIRTAMEPERSGSSGAGQFTN